MSFFITAGGGYKSGSSYSNTNTSAALNQMTNAAALSPNTTHQSSFKTGGGSRFKGSSG